MSSKRLVVASNPQPRPGFIFLGYMPDGYDRIDGIIASNGKMVLYSLPTKGDKPPIRWNGEKWEALTASEVIR